MSKVPVSAVRTRFGLSLTLAVISGFLVVESLAFGHGTASNIGWPVGIGALVCSIALSPTVRRTRPRLFAWEAIAGIATILSGWQIVQALVFSDKTAAWLTFADGCALVVTALGALVLNELSTERVVHALEVFDRRSHEHDQHLEREPATAGEIRS